MQKLNTNMVEWKSYALTTFRSTMFRDNENTNLHVFVFAGKAAKMAGNRFFDAIR